jgi:thymidylate kinase
MPLIVLEGVDGSGKSTLAETLSLCYGDDVDLVHLGAPAGPDTAIDECLEPLSNYDPTSNRAVIFDRAHWGCPVYGSLYRPELDHDGYGEMGHHGWRYTELFFESRGAVTILVDADPKIAEARCRERGEDYIDLGHISLIVARYLDLFHESLTGVLKRRLLTMSDTAELTTEIIKIAQVKADLIAPLARWHHYVGPRRPDVLIVCEPSREVRMAALEHMMKVHFDWQLFGFASSGSSELDPLWNELGHPDVVTYGDVNPSVAEWASARWR